MDLENQWTPYRTRFLVRARQLTQPLIFTDALGREQSGQSGDYLVESPEGLKRIVPKIPFEDIYVPLDPAYLRAPIAAPHPTVRSAVPYGVNNGAPKEGSADVLARPPVRSSAEQHTRATA